MLIVSNKELRTAYEILNYVGKSNSEYVENLKKDIRAYHYVMSKRRAHIIKGKDFDYTVVKIICPENITSKVEAIKYFNDIYYLRNYSSFGCTGKPFTIRCKVTKQGGKWVIYHFIGRDC